MLNAALATLHDEHRSLAAVVHGLRYLVRELRRGVREPDFELLRAMTCYIEAFPEKLHHPKEDAYLFARLRARTHVAEPALKQLERQHRESARQLAKLKQSLDDYAAGSVEGFDRFAAAVEEFAEETWQHMNTEEKIVVPLATKFLTPEDWIEIAQAFGENGDPRFGREPDHEFRKLFAQIVALAPPPIGDAMSGPGG